MKRHILAVCFAAGAAGAFGQAEMDALRFSIPEIKGTARFVGMGGAFGALGGDMSALEINPAGIGIYRTSEISLSPAYQRVISSADFNGSVQDVAKEKLLMNGFGYVGTFKTYDESPVSNINFAVTYSRQNDFNYNTRVIGYDRYSSLLDRVCNLENNLIEQGYNDYHTSFYDYVTGTKVIGYNSSLNKYQSALGADEKVSVSDMDMTESGGINSWNLTLGANIEHSVYIGLGVGIKNVAYDMLSSYVESFENGGAIELRNALKTTGTGFDFKIGAIYRVNPSLRLGYAYRTGTYYTMTDVFNASMISDKFVNPNPKVVGTETHVDYSLRTPSVMTLSGAYQIGKSGLVSMDIDYVNYINTQLKDANGYPMTEANYYISKDFRKQFNIRVGGEVRMDEFSARFGLGYQFRPMISNIENLDIATAYTRPQYSINNGTALASGGFGYRNGPFFVDLAVQQALTTEHYFNYYQNNSIEPSYATTTRTKSNLVLTVGYKF